MVSVCVGGALRLALKFGHVGDGDERDQVVFSGEAAGEPAGESVELREPPIPMCLVWPGMVIGAVDHAG